MRESEYGGSNLLLEMWRFHCRCCSTARSDYRSSRYDDYGRSSRYDDYGAPRYDGYRPHRYSGYDPYSY